MGRNILTDTANSQGSASGRKSEDEENPDDNPPDFDQGPLSNAEIRRWYVDQVERIKELNEQWIREGLSAEERARRAQKMRHDIRLRAQGMMQNPDEVEALRRRDIKEYGNPDGPTFEQLMQEAKDEGLSGDAIYEYIIEKSIKTNPDVNKRFGVG